MRHYADEIGRAQQLQQPVFEPAGTGQGKLYAQKCGNTGPCQLHQLLSRAEELMKLARFCYEHKGHLLDTVEVDPNEL